MARVLRDPAQTGGREDEAGRPIVAHLHGGPLSGREQVLYRPRTYFSARVHRGQVRRMLNMSRRHAWYELERTWEEDDFVHGSYRYLGMRAEQAPRDAVA